MSTCIMLVGLPCSGKSTFLHNFLITYKKFNPIAPKVISLDNHIEAEATRLGVTYDKAWNDHRKTADKRYREDMRQAAANGRDMIIDMTNLTVKSRRRKMNEIDQAAKAFGHEYTYHAFIISADYNTMRARNYARPGKTIPDRVMEQMIKSYVLPSHEEGFEHIEIIQY